MECLHVEYEDGIDGAEEVEVESTEMRCMVLKCSKLVTGEHSTAVETFSGVLDENMKIVDDGMQSILNVL